jgi:iron complex outermembrane receptor protein
MNATRARLSRMSNVIERNILQSAADTEKASDYNSHYLSDRYLEKGDYLRLSTLSIAYNFNKFTDYIQNLRVYASCNNVFVIYRLYKDMDPEVNMRRIDSG